MTYLASRIDKQQEDNTRKLFFEMDSNRNGYISIDELHNYCIGNEAALSKYSTLMSGVDLDNNGKINYTGRTLFRF
jgi:Ca2+-binding EF-hand superfamily protein